MATEDTRDEEVDELARLLAEDDDDGEIVNDDQSPEAPTDAVLVDGSEDQAPGSNIQGTEQDTDFNPDQFTLKFRGDEIKPKSREELINLAQRGVLYDRKNYELAQKQKALTDREAELAQLSQLSNMIKTNPQAAQVVQEIQRRVAEAQQESAEQQGVNPEVVAEYQRMQTEMEMLKQQQEDVNIQNQINQIRTKYPEDLWDVPNTAGKTLLVEVLEHTMGKGFPDIESAYKDLMWDRMSAKAEAEALKKVTPQPDPTAAAVAGAGSASGSAAGVDLSKMSYDDLASLAASELS